MVEEHGRQWVVGGTVYNSFGDNRTHCYNTFIIVTHDSGGRELWRREDQKVVV